MMGEWQTPLPPLPEQRVIAHILGTLDDKIELNRRTNETLEAMARALFQSWFVDFDPVKRNIERRRGKPVSAAGGMEELDALLPDSFVDSELGKIPKRWKVASLPTVIQVNPRVPLKPGAVASYLDMKNMPTASARAVGVTERPFSSGSKFLQGDTLVARITPCLENGKTAYVDFLPEGVVGTGSTEFIVLRPVSTLPKTYGYFLARTPDFRKFAISNMTGTSGRQRVQPNCLQHFTIVVASQSILMKFGKFGDGVLDAMRHARR